MEIISTPHVALLPRVANLLTLAVVVAATWWSGTQRPPIQPAMAVAGSPTAVAAPQPKTNETTVGTGTSHTANWPAEASLLPRDGLQIVGYRPRIQR